jgi:hypothetical protein
MEIPSQLFLNDCRPVSCVTVLSTKRRSRHSVLTRKAAALYLAFTDDASQPSQYFHFVEPAEVTETAERDHRRSRAILRGAWADCNEDSLLDLARAHWNHAVDVPDALYVGQPDGRFIEQGEVAGVGVRGRRYDVDLWADYDTMVTSICSCPIRGAVAFEQATGNVTSSTWPRRPAWRMPGVAGHMAAHGGTSTTTAGSI